MAINRVSVYISPHALTVRRYTIKVDAESANECAGRLDGTTTIFAFSNGKKRCETYTQEQCSGEITQESQDWCVRNKNCC